MDPKRLVALYTGANDGLKLYRVENNVLVLHKSGSLPAAATPLGANAAARNRVFFDKIADKFVIGTSNGTQPILYQVDLKLLTTARALAAAAGGDASYSFENLGNRNYATFRRNAAQTGARTVAFNDNSADAYADYNTDPEATTQVRGYAVSPDGNVVVRFGHNGAVWAFRHTETINGKVVDRTFDETVNTITALPITDIRGCCWNRTGTCLFICRVSNGFSRRLNWTGSGFVNDGNDIGQNGAYYEVTHMEADPLLNDSYYVYNFDVLNQYTPSNPAMIHRVVHCTRPAGHTGAVNDWFLDEVGTEGAAVSDTGVLMIDPKRRKALTLNGKSAPTDISAAMFANVAEATADITAGAFSARLVSFGAEAEVGSRISLTKTDAVLQQYQSEIEGVTVDIEDMEGSFGRIENHIGKVKSRTIISQPGGVEVVNQLAPVVTEIIANPANWTQVVNRLAAVQTRFDAYQFYAEVDSKLTPVRTAFGAYEFYINAASKTAAVKTDIQARRDLEAEIENRLAPVRTFFWTLPYTGVELSNTLSPVKTLLDVAHSHGDMANRLTPVRTRLGVWPVIKPEIENRLTPVKTEIIVTLDGAFLVHNQIPAAKTRIEGRRGGEANVANRAPAAKTLFVVNRGVDAHVSNRLSPVTARFVAAMPMEVRVRSAVKPVKTQIGARRTAEADIFQRLARVRTRTYLLREGEDMSVFDAPGGVKFQYTIHEWRIGGQGFDMKQWSDDR